MLVLSLFCNPMAGFAVAVADISGAENSVATEMACQEGMMQSRGDQNVDDEAPCPMDCCDDDCDLDQSCQSCLHIHFASAVLFEVFDVTFSYTRQANLELASTQFPYRSILPEIQPPASLHTS